MIRIRNCDGRLEEFGSASLSLDHLRFFSSNGVQTYDGMTKFRPSTPLLTNRKTADQLNEMLLVEENENDQKFDVPAYAHTLVLRKELRRSRLYF